MKKILIMFFEAVMILSFSTAALASASNVSVKNNEPDMEPITYSYESGKIKSSSASVKTLMTNLDGLSKQDSVVQTLTITSENTDNLPVNFTLRLALANNESQQVKPEPEKKYSEEDYLSLDYYNIKITDANGSVIYSFEDENEENKEREFKDFDLGIMNRESAVESKIFNITVSVNKELNKDSIANSAKKLDWRIISEVQSENEEIVSNDESMPAQENNNSSLAKDKNGTMVLSSGEYFCGEDIEPGRYTMTGTGKVHVYADDGALKATVALKNKDDESAKGVSEYTINLNDGECLVVDEEIKMAPFSGVKSTSKPQNSSSAKSASSNKESNSNAKTTAKTNPKTGDKVSIGVISCITIAAIGAFVLIELKKRKNN